MKLCVFIPGLSLVAGILCFGAAAMPVQAGAEVHVSGSFGEAGGKNGDHSGAENATASVTDESDYSDTYTATGSVAGTTLKAKAQAYFASGTGFGAVSTAQSTWTDTLTLMNPELIQPFAAGTVFLYFVPVAAGQGRYGEAVLSASLKPAGGQEIAGQKRAVFGAGSIGGALRVALKLDPHQFSSGGGVDFKMDLRVEIDNTMPMGSSANVDFTRAATLPPVFVGDASGKPIPALAGLIIKGSSGKTYPVTIVPDVPVLIISKGSWPWQVMLSWDTARDDCVLESSPTMAAGSWVPAEGLLSVNGTAHSQAANAESGTMFFRLRCP